jgi:hypothetical protein
MFDTGRSYLQIQFDLFSLLMLVLPLVVVFSISFFLKCAEATLSADTEHNLICGSKSLNTITGRKPLI